MVNLADNILIEVKQAALGELWLPKAGAVAFTQEPPEPSSGRPGERSAALRRLNFGWIPVLAAGRAPAVVLGCGVPPRRGLECLGQALHCLPAATGGSPAPVGLGLGERRVAVPELGDTRQPAGRCPDRRDPRDPDMWPQTGGISQPGDTGSMDKGDPWVPQSPETGTPTGETLELL